MELGAFSISLTVKDLQASRKFYEKFGFTVRDLQRKLKAQGVMLMSEADENTTGPASFIAVDPDGNPIMVDQHV
jgi:lactoylglutathione lyase